MNPNYSFTFTQRNLMSSSFCAFEEMRKSGELADFKIDFGNRSIVGHRIVLAAAIPYFRTIFSSSEKDITLHEVKQDALESVINFSYSGMIQITSENVKSLLSASKFLELADLHEACWRVLEKNLGSNNAWEIRTLAVNHLRFKLIAIADQYIRQNFEVFSQSEDFLAVPSSYLKEVISRDDVRVGTEENIFEAVIRWVKVSLSDRRDLLPDLLDAVRKPFLSPDYLSERISSDEFVRTSIPCRDWVDGAKLYHMLPEEKLHKFATRPRIYDTKLQHDMTHAYNIDDHGVYAVCKSESEISIKLLDMEDEKWINLSTYRHKFLDNVASLNGIIYVLLRETIVTFDVNTQKWHPLDTTVHEPCYSSGIVFHRNTLYLFGGEDNLASSVRCYDVGVNKWKKEEDMPIPCQNPGVTSLRKYIYITGGDFEGHVYKSAQRYDPAAKEWIEITPMLSERVCHGCTSLNGRIYVYGGYDGHYKNSETGEVYDPLTDQWNFVSAMKSVLWRFSFISNNGKLYALERMPTFSSHEVDVQIYDPECDKWEFGVPVIHDDASDIFLVSAEVSTEYDMKGTEKATQ